MYTNGTLLQPCLGSRQGSDFLSTKLAVTCVTTANIREREKLSRENTSMEKEKTYTGSSYDFRKNQIRQRMEKIKKQADIAKEKRRIAEEKRKKEEEEREKKKKKSTGKVAFSGGFGKVKTSNSGISQDALAELIEGLNLEDEDDEEGGSEEEEAEQDISESGLKIDELASQEAGTDKSNGKGKGPVKRVTFSNPATAGPTRPQSERKEGTAPSSEGPFAKMAFQKLKMVAEKASLSEKKSSSGNLTKKRSNLTPDAIKMLAQRLRGGDRNGNNENITEDQRKVIQLLAQGAGANQDSQNGGRLRKSLTRMLTQAHLRNVGLGLIKEEKQSGWLPLGRMRRHDPEREARRDKFLKSFYLQSYSLPPISSVEPPQFQSREFGNLNEPTIHPETTEDEWQELPSCRYLRYSKKFYTDKDIVCLDLDKSI